MLQLTSLKTSTSPFFYQDIEDPYIFLSLKNINEKYIPIYYYSIVSKIGSLIEFSFYSDDGCLKGLKIISLAKIDTTFIDLSSLDSSMGENYVCPTFDLIHFDFQSYLRIENIVKVSIDINGTIEVNFAEILEGDFKICRISSNVFLKYNTKGMLISITLFGLKQTEIKHLTDIILE